MAKGSMDSHIREAPYCQTRQQATSEDQSDTELFSLVQNTDYVPPKEPKPEPRSEKDAPLKGRLALGYIRVNGREEPFYTPIRGFEHLFNQDPVPAPWTRQARQARAADALNSKRAVPRATISNQGRNPSTASSCDYPSAPSRGVKRRRARPSREDEDADDADEDVDPAAAGDSTKTFRVGDIAQLKAFYAARFRELTMKPLRDIVTAWVKSLEPRRQQQYGPYLRYKSYNHSEEPKRSEGQKSTRPPWWPASIPYVEPSHLKLRHLVPLAVDIMLVHRRIDEACGKRKYPSWISKLELDAEYHVRSKDTEHFSSSKDARYNEAMQKRALEIILPSLFDIGKSHEEYIAQFGLYEGSGNVDPGCGKLVSWQPAPRPDRTNAWKRSRSSSKPSSRVGKSPVEEPHAEEPRVEDVRAEDDAGYETEVDEELNYPNTSFSSFHSAFSYTEDVKMFPEAIAESPLPLAVEPALAQLPFQHSAQSSITTQSPHFDHQALGRFYLDDAKVSEVNGTAHERLHFDRNPTCETVNTTDRFLSPLHSGRSVAPSNYGPTTTGHLPTNFTYAYPSGVVQAPSLGDLQAQAPNFGSSGPMAHPEMARLDSTFDTHGLPLDGLHAHGLPMHTVPTHDLPMHNFPTHAMPLHWGGPF